MECTEQEPFIGILEAAPNFSQQQNGDDRKGTLMSDWLGRPIGDDRVDLMGGWKCSFCVIGAFGCVSIAYFGIALNLVTYLVQVCGLTNAEAANTVTNMTGTIYLCSFIGAFVADAYMGRLQAYLTFQFLCGLSYVSISIAVLVISKGPATAAMRSYLLVSLYLMAITGGSVLPNITVIGADQLATPKEKGKYFRLLAISTSVGQLFSVTLVTYIDNRDMWAWGFGLCTAVAVISMTLLIAGMRYFRQSRAVGNPFLRVIQVPVAAWRKRSLCLTNNSSLLLHVKSQGEFTSNSVCDQLQHTGSLSFLEKAAVLGPTDADNQVEELRSLLRVIAVGIAIILVTATTIQASTLFEEQANLMNRQVTTWLFLPAASLNVFAIGSSILTGILVKYGARLVGLCSTRIRGWKQEHAAGAAKSLQLQGAGLVCCILVMVIAALVESHRLHAAQDGTVISVLWLVPQTVFAGAGGYVAIVGGLDFFYSEVPDGLRTVGSAVFLILEGAGSYLSSLLVALVTAITTRGGKPGWIASDFNEGHVDYFYWSCVAFTLGIFLVYTRNYPSRASLSEKQDLEQIRTGQGLPPPTVPCLFNQASARCTLPNEALPFLTLPLEAKLAALLAGVNPAPRETLLSWIPIAFNSKKTFQLQSIVYHFLIFL